MAASPRKSSRWWTRWELCTFRLTAWVNHDLIGVKPLIQDVEFDMFLGDKAFDADWLRTELNERAAIAVIPPKSNPKAKLDCDFHAYRRRQLVENFFCRPKYNPVYRFKTREKRRDLSRHDQPRSIENRNAPKMFTGFRLLSEPLPPSAFLRHHYYPRSRRVVRLRTIGSWVAD